MTVLKTSKAKENILRRVRESLLHESVPKPFPEIESGPAPSIYTNLNEFTIEETFAHEFTNSGGQFVFCNDMQDFALQLNALANAKNWKEVVCALPDVFASVVSNGLNFVREINFRNEGTNACITGCEAAIARTGSVLFSSRQQFGRTAPIYFPAHIVVVYAHNIVADIDIALQMIQNKYGINNMPSMLNLNTGPSRTADIEKTLVTGVHGPKEVFCFFVNQ